MDSVRDYRLKNGMKVAELLPQMQGTGFQATKLGEALEIIKRMKAEKATVFFAFTANMVASGLRGVFAQLLEEKLVDVVITTGGAIEHDFIKAHEPYLLGDFSMDDRELHKREINRLGNILVPTERYVLLEKKMKPIFTRLYEKKRIISPSELISEMGKETKDEGSFLHWAYRNKIPVFCPGVTDSAIGLNVYFFKQQHKDFGIDVSADMKALGDIVINADRTGAIILGGGIAKHHTIGANILRGGLDYGVYITTAQPWDGSLSGARTSEAISWGKINEKARHVTVDGDATVLFPLLACAMLEGHK
jgi:deoxyhypusine synthase